VSPRYVPGVSWTWHVGHEVEIRTEPQDPAAARQEAVERAREQVLAQLPAAADVLEEQMSVAYDPAAGVVRATVTLEVLQDLGRFVPSGTGLERDGAQHEEGFP